MTATINERLRVAAICLLAATLSGALPSLGETASDPAGFYKLTFLGNSDSIVSLPFSRPPASVVVVDSVSGNSVQVLGSPGWTPNQFVYAAGAQSNNYYLRFDSGAKEGAYCPITANGTNSLTLNLGSDTLTGVSFGDRCSVVPYWTFGTVFPNGKGVNIASSALSSHPTDVLIPNYAGNGINLSAAATYYFLSNATTAAAWRRVTPATTNSNDEILQPNAYLIVRNRLATNTTYVSLGQVMLAKIAVPLRVNPSSKQDNLLAITRPVSVSLNDSGLLASGAITPSTSALSPTDLLITFDNATTNFNKSAAATYFYFNSGWRKVTAPLTINFGTSNIFTPGSGFVVRKASGSTAPVWTHSATY
jgi:uncharacterized protein (TIGR02597 family)